MGDLGLIYARRKQYEEAADMFRSALTIHRVAGNRLGEATQSNNLGNVSRAEGDRDTALQCYQSALAGFRDVGYPLGEAQALGNLGIIFANERHLDRAQQNHSDALAIYRRIGSRVGEGDALANLGFLASVRGETQEACRLLRKAASVYDSMRLDSANREIVRAKLKELGCEEPGATGSA